MVNTKNKFYGQQEDEKILYATKPHYLKLILDIFMLGAISFTTFIILFTLSTQIKIFTIFGFLAFLVPLSIFIVGFLIIKNMYQRNINYITDRRVVRFDPTTILATNIRTIAWDEVVKVKTFSRNIIFKELKIGNVVVHARTTIKTINDDSQTNVSADDIEIKDVFMYKDLGNYIDKILYIYKRSPKKVSQIHPFVEKEKGLRY